MYDNAIEKLNKLLEDGILARKFAWDYYDKLVMRESAFTLYGPYGSGIGAGMPGNVIPQKARELTKSTKRKNYLRYELDAKYNLLRVKRIWNYSKTECIFHCFQIGGTLYAVPFIGERKKEHHNQTVAVYFDNGKPNCLTFSKNTNLMASFFEYVSEHKMITTSYAYSVNSLCSNIAVNNGNSSYLEEFINEEEPIWTDFSRFF